MNKFASIKSSVFAYNIYLNMCNCSIMLPTTYRDIPRLCQDIKGALGDPTSTCLPSGIPHQSSQRSWPGSVPLTQSSLCLRATGRLLLLFCVHVVPSLGAFYRLRSLPRDPLPAPRQASSRHRARHSPFRHGSYRSVLRHWFSLCPPTRLEGFIFIFVVLVSGTMPWNW